MSQEYNTKQKTILINFLKNNTNRQFSINEIAKGVENSGIGKSTVYRQMSNLLEEGIVRRYRGQGKTVVYQYADKDMGCHKHFHLKCSDCGKIIHLDCHHIMNLMGHITEEHGFSIDMANTVLYGRCNGCRKGI